MKSIKTVILLFAAINLWSCNNNDKSTTGETTDSVKSGATDTAPSPPKMEAANAEQDFINYAVPGNTKEIAWLKAAMARASSKEIKDHASMMLKDHNKLGANVKDYLSKHPNLTMPSVDTANVVNINDKTGADWDKAWTDKMVDDHQGLLDKLKKSQGDVKDADLNKLITNTIPVVESHLAMAKSLQDKMKK
jgi:putative membrane protein